MVVVVAQMVGVYFLLSDVVVRTSSMWSIAGITVARFGESHKKKRVACLRICHDSHMHIVCLCLDQHNAPSRHCKY